MLRIGPRNCRWEWKTYVPSLNRTFYVGVICWNLFVLIVLAVRRH